MTKRQLKTRLIDLYTGAYGHPPDEENPELMYGGGAEDFSRLLRSIKNSFSLKEDEAKVPYALRHWNIGHYETIDTLTEFIWSQLETEA
jgi:hypothetical protein